MFGKELVVMADFDGGKTIDEVEFNFIPIWVRIFKMPLGLMNKAAGELIGGMVGEVLSVDADENGLAVGEFLRVKVMLDIRNPLMRGVTLDVGEGNQEKKKWCPLVYEYLPDFCYLCGLIGHVDKACPVYTQKGAEPQFSRALRFIPEKKKFGDDLSKKSVEQRSMLPWRNERKRASGGSGSWGSSERKGSDSGSWRKDEIIAVDKQIPIGEEKEFTSPLKQDGVVLSTGDAKKSLPFDRSAVAEGEKIEMAPGDVNSGMQEEKAEDVREKENKKGSSGKERSFRRLKRDQQKGEKSESSLNTARKRLREENEMEIDGVDRVSKIGKNTEAVKEAVQNLAGPADRPCQDQ